MASIFPAEAMARHNLTPNLLDVETMFGEVYKAVWSIDQALNATTPTDKVKVVNPFDAESEKDEAAKEIAADLLDKFLISVTEQVEANPHVAWHMAQLDKRISSFMTSEVGFYRWESSKATGVKSTEQGNAELKGDLVTLNAFLRKLFAMDEDGFAKVAGVKSSKGKSGNVLLTLPSTKGPKGESSTPTGKFSLLWSVQWTVNGESLPPATDSRFIIRLIWTGAERTGKRPGDLYEPWKDAKGDKCKPGESVTLTLNGKTVIATMTDLSESDDDESE